MPQSNRHRHIFLALTLWFLASATYAQKIQYTAGGKMKTKNRVTRLIGDVKFIQDKTIVYCDSAIFYKKDNIMEAFSNVRILDGDSVTITGDKLTYDGNARRAMLRSNVVYTSGTRRLYTDNLDYNILLKIANFSEGGKLVDEQNTLESVTGIYYGFTDQAVFYQDVDLIATTFTLDTDTLKYNTVSKVAITEGYTVIVTDKDEQIISDGGEYRTVRDQIDIVDGIVETIDYYLEGDELYYDDFKKYHRAIGNVKMTHKNQDVIITGEEAFYDKTNGFSKVFGDPVMKRVMEVDTFYMSSDTLVAIESEFDSLKRIQAFKDVKIFKSNLQGVSDSVAYFMSDSLIYMYTDPVLWTNGNQIEADTISLLLRAKTLDKMFLYKNSFLVSQDTLLQFNQVKGRNMIATFNGNAIKNIEVIGNGESLYFALTPEKSAILAVNKIICSNMMIRFRENTLSNISFYKQPEAKTIPPHELTEADRMLEGFEWRTDEKPTLFDVITRTKIKLEKSEPTTKNPESEEYLEMMINKNKPVKLDVEESEGN